MITKSYDMSLSPICMKVQLFHEAAKKERNQVGGLEQDKLK